MIGGNLVRALKNEGFQIRALIHHDQRAIAGLDIETVQADITDQDSLYRAFQGAETVFHCAGLISLNSQHWDDLAAINIAGTHNVVQACLQCKVKRLIYFSSIQALTSEQGDRLVDENRPLADYPSAPPYDRSKALAEKEVLAGMQKGLEVVILYPTGVLGPFDFKPSFVGQALLLLAEGKLPGLVKGGFDWVDVRDVAYAAVQAYLHASPGEKYILSGHWHSVTEFASLVAAWNHKHAPRLVFPVSIARLAMPILPFLSPLFGISGDRVRDISNVVDWLQVNRYISHAHADHDLAYHPRPLDESIVDTMNWFEQNGNLLKSHD